MQFSGGFTFSGAGMSMSIPAPPQYWFDIISTASTTNASGVDVDASGNVYVSMSSPGLQTVKLTSQGSQVWQRNTTGVSTSHLNDIVVTSDGTAYVTGDTYNVAGSSAEVYISKYNSDGVVQWQVSVGNTGPDAGNSIELTSSGNIVVTGYYKISTIQYIYTAMFNSSGTVQWQRGWGGGTNSVSTGTGSFVDSQDNIYVVGKGTSSTRLTNIYKLDTSGTTTDECSFGKSTIAQDPRDVVVDSTGNVYVSINVGASSGCLVKIKSDFSQILWQKLFTATAESVAIDSSDNIYMLGYYTGGYGLNDLYIAKINTSGSIVWQRRFGSSTNQNSFTGRIAVDNADSVYITARDGQSPERALVLKLPADGSLTGTYGDYTYGTASITPSDYDFGFTASAMTGIIITDSATSRSLTDAAGNLTISTTVMS